VSALHDGGIEVYALDGSRELALPANHEVVFETIRHVIRFNEGAEPDERFDGVRYDIEPYLLPGFHGPRRPEILLGYLEVLSRGADLARAGGLRFGADIPFWFDSPDEVTYEAVTARFRGAEKPVSEHVIDLADDVAVMAYRTQAFGADGVLRQAADELRYASTQGKRAWIALETGPLPDETLIDFKGEPRPDRRDLAVGSGAVGIAAAGDSLVVIWAPAGAPALQTGAHADAAIDSVRWWPVTRRVEVPAAKLSFWTLGPDRLRETMAEVEGEAGHQESFAGFAIHYSESYGALLTSTAP
jgi:hypothetical protein